MLLSIMVPCYNEEQALPFFYAEITKVAAELKQRFSLDTEFIFIDDGSKDRTLKIIRALREEDLRVRYVSFSRNFGKEAGIYSGLSAAKGDYIALMDADLQDPPELLAEMYEKVSDPGSGYDCAATRRISRKGEPKLRSLFSRMFYRLINRISKTEIVDGARDFRLMTRRMVDAILSMAEYNRFSKGIFSWVGFDTYWIAYENVERVAGTTKWSFWGLLKYSLEGIIGFSTVPLAIASFCGLVFCLLAFLLILFIVLRAAIWGDPVAGWPSTICLLLFIGGVQLFCLGIVGQYISKTYLEVKKRPIYIVRETEDGSVGKKS